ncbi:hypothetical protein FA95DRAFT_1598698 [Auriscalpium vulgare]|uniref:Uncharacterized protein n=1 Tax=Auriscalpium vulgare TaxID=40419 RepID=A0ACB8RD15_9AGAM|nr:hypothetical protein FA95DRAFT_1598698 [Auriscalpium vulgare]
MATAAVLSPHDVHTQLTYFVSTTTGEPPYNYTYSPPEGTPQSNIVRETYPMTIHDVRGKEDTVSLDTTGFAFIKHVSEEKEFVDDEAITSKYYKEVEEILKKEAGAKKVFIFDHTIRGRSRDGNKPQTRVHVDQSFESGLARVRRHLPEDADRLLQGRVRIINVWRPIANPVAHHPLAVADWRTLNPDEELVSTRHISPDREGTTFCVKYNPKHQWYYQSNQTPEEVTLLKIFDSDETPGRARLTPHSAFLDTTHPADAPQRQSIEIRALVFDRE